MKYIAEIVVTLEIEASSQDEAEAIADSLVGQDAGKVYHQNMKGTVVEVLTVDED